MNPICPRNCPIRDFTDEESAPATRVTGSLSRIKVYDNGLVGNFESYVQRSGADEGDVLAVEFDLVHKVAVLHLGDEELLEDLISGV